MNDVCVEWFELNGEKVKTTVVNIMNNKVIDDHISSLLRSASENGTNVIGFDSQCYLSTNYVKGICSCFRSICVNLNFCVGHSCLIIRLTQFNLQSSFSSFKSLQNFLSLPEYTFVGVGIKDNFANLEKQYGFGCRNAVELAPLAGRVMDNPRLSSCGVDVLAGVVNKLDLRKHRPYRVDFDWDSNPLSIELVKLATVNVYSYYKIGSTLLGRDALIPPELAFKKKIKPEPRFEE